MPVLVVLVLVTSALDTACQAGLDCDSGKPCDDAAGGNGVLSGGSGGLTTAGSNAGGVANLGGGVSAHAGSSGAAASNGGSMASGGTAMGGDAASGGSGGAIGGSGVSGGGGASGGTGGGGTSGHAGAALGGMSGSTGSGGSAGSMAAGGSGGKAGNGGAGGGGAGSGGVAGGGGQVDPYASARQTCVDRVNQLRASKGLGAIPRLALAESCADGQAKTDSQTGMAHSAFNACLNQVQGWTGAAQNECPGWGSVADTLSGCIDAMWGEGPGGGHYDNMVGDYDHIACGFYTTPQGKVWMVQDFWRK